MKQMVATLDLFLRIQAKFRETGVQRRRYATTFSITSSTVSLTISFFPVVVEMSVSGVRSMNSIRSAFTTIFSSCCFASFVNSIMEESTLELPGTPPTGGARHASIQVYVSWPRTTA